jgi:hypothetical protein
VDVAHDAPISPAPSTATVRGVVAAVVSFISVMRSSSAAHTSAVYLKSVAARLRSSESKAYISG